MFIGISGLTGAGKRGKKEFPSWEEFDREQAEYAADIMGLEYPTRAGARLGLAWDGLKKKVDLLQSARSRLALAAEAAEEKAADDWPVIVETTAAIAAVLREASYKIDLITREERERLKARHGAGSADDVH